jgi:hypothetical protein
MRRRRPSKRRWAGCGCLVLLLLFAPVLLTFGAFGTAAYLDSEREVIAGAVSPDGRWIAQLERLTVGGAPNLVVTLRRSWHPNWYLTSCKSVSYYGESTVVLRWTSRRTLVVDAATDPSHWDSLAPFNWTWPWSRSEDCGVGVEVR